MSSIGDLGVLVLKHAPWEGPGRIGPALAAHGLAVHTRTLVGQRNPPVPDLVRYSGLVVLGGPMRATDTATHPALAIERDLIRAAVERDLPVLGICLGHQLLSLALGGELIPDAVEEIGIAPLDLVGDRLTGTSGPLDVLHWHRDNASLPPGAEVLASTPGCPNQAFRLGSALGLQFHLEVDPGMLDRWLDVASVRAELPGSPAEQIESTRRVESSMGAAAGAVFSAYARSVAGF